MRAILGIKVSFSNIGWALISESTSEILESGVRVFEGLDIEKNKQRRDKRISRRKTRRKQNKLNDLTVFLNSNNFFKSESNFQENIYLRNKGLNEKLTRSEIFDVLYHLAKYRGVSYIEDIDDEQLELHGNGNNEVFRDMLPCEIQLEKMNLYGKYRGDILNDKALLKNIFTTAMYCEEAERILKTQSIFHEEINDEFIQEYLLLLIRKREYQTGPGNELSRTNYGVYKTNGVTLDDLNEGFRGKCSIYNKENRLEDLPRASAASITMQYCNLLNYLCNIRYKGSKISKEQKREIIEYIMQSKSSISLIKVLQKLYNYSESVISGIRLDDKNKDEKVSIESYRIINKYLKERKLDINNFEIRTLDNIIDILTKRKDTDSIISDLNQLGMMDLSQEEIQVFVDIKRKNKQLFSKWSDFSYKAIDEITKDMLNTGDSLYKCIENIEKNIFQTNYKDEIDSGKILKKIYNPDISRPIIQAVKIINALSKKYEFSDIIIEMPKYKSIEDEKIGNRVLKKNRDDEIKKALSLIGLSKEELEDFEDKDILEKVVLFYRQQGRCLYSGKYIEKEEFISRSLNYRIDYIIPITASFDDSISNKVLVCEENKRDSVDQTISQYILSNATEWDIDTYDNYVEELYAAKLINRKHYRNLLLQKSMHEPELVRNFVKNNILNKRYESQVLLNELNRFYLNKEKNINIKMISDKVTNQFKQNLELQEDREKYFKHIAEDAMMCCFIQLSLNIFNDNYINLDNGKIIDKELFSELEDRVDSYLFFSNKDTSDKIKQFNSNIKISHKMDTKINRKISDETIYSTRKIDDSYFVVSKIKNIYEDQSYEKFIKKVKEDPTKFLMFKNDIKTWDKLMGIVDMYPNSKNPFKQYRENFGEIRKWSKKINAGPIVKEIKYLDKKLGVHLDISNKYDQPKNPVVLMSLKLYRADVFYNESSQSYNIIPIRYADFRFQKGKYSIPIEVYERILRQEKVLSEEESFNDLGINIKFKFSLFRNNIIELTEGGISTKYRFVSKSQSNKNRFEIRPIEFNFERQTYVGFTARTEKVEKYESDILGNYYKVKKEELVLDAVLDNLMI